MHIGYIQSRLEVAFVSEFFASDLFNSQLVRINQAEIIVVKHLIQGRNSEAWVGVEPSS